MMHYFFVMHRKRATSVEEEFYASDEGVVRNSGLDTASEACCILPGQHGQWQHQLNVQFAV